MASAMASSTIMGTSLAQKVNRTASKPAARLVVRASLKKNVQKLVAAGMSAPVILASHPAFAAVVEERLNGDGTGRALGINDSALGLALVGTFTLVWALYYNSQKELGGDENDESGLTL
ncbi:hypothetical protein BSKO_04997 [Bryopsis sp. KO-2023]|nr:hypothetical protein BSKO_04997 [Bryopsis sp. KO-2023]